MSVATPNTVQSRARLAALPTPGHLASRIEILENAKLKIPKIDLTQPRAWPAV